jgi:hypothetical protein
VSNACIDKYQSANYEFMPSGDDREPDGVINVLQSKGSSKLHQDPKTDESGHGTAVASKAVGRKFGLAKQVCSALGPMDQTKIISRPLSCLYSSQH